MAMNVSGPPWVVDIPPVSGAWNQGGLTPTARQTGVDLFGPSVSGVTITPSAGAGCTITSSGAVTINGETHFNVQANATSAAANYVELAIAGFAPLSGDSATLEFRGDCTVGTIITPYLGTAAYAQFVTNNFVEQAATGISELFNAGLRAHHTRDSQWTKNGFTGTFASTTIREMVWTAAKIRITIPNGGSANLNFRSLRAGSRRGKGTICFTADDGYSSVYQLAAPLFESYSIPLTMAIIPALVGTAGYMTEAQLKELVGRGHLCVAHGPNQNLTNLFDSPYTSTASRVADAAYVAQWLRDRGLTTAAGSKCYIWPQGRYAAGSSGDTALVESFQTAGFVAGRGVSTGSVSPSLYAGSLSANCATRMLFPVIGHSYAGASNTADDATETTNISNIVTRIQDLGTYGLDGMTMLHKFVARGAATAGSIEIEIDRVKTLLAAATTEIQAGRLTAVKMDAYASMAG